jgi:hypothetical protein
MSLILKIHYDIEYQSWIPEIRKRGPIFLQSSGGEFLTIARGHKFNSFL